MCKWLYHRLFANGLAYRGRFWWAVAAWLHERVNRQNEREAFQLVTRAWFALEIYAPNHPLVEELRAWLVDNV